MESTFEYGQAYIHRGDMQPGPSREMPRNMQPGSFGGPQGMKLGGSFSSSSNDRNDSGMGLKRKMDGIYDDPKRKKDDPPTNTQFDSISLERTELHKEVLELMAQVSQGSKAHQLKLLKQIGITDNFENKKLAAWVCYPCKVQSQSKQSYVQHCTGNKHKHILNGLPGYIGMRLALTNTIKALPPIWKKFGISQASNRKPPDGDPIDLSKHGVTEHRKGLNECQPCGKYFMLMDRLQTHLKSGSHAQRETFLKTEFGDSWKDYYWYNQSNTQSRENMEPKGVTFVLPVSGFYCNLCLKFYSNEVTAKDIHCRTLSHVTKVKEWDREHLTKKEKVSFELTKEDIEEAVREKEVTTVGTSRCAPSKIIVDSSQGVLVDSDKEDSSKEKHGKWRNKIKKILAIGELTEQEVQQMAKQEQEDKINQEYQKREAEKKEKLLKEQREKDMKEQDKEDKEWKEEKRESDKKVQDMREREQKKKDRIQWEKKVRERKEKGRRVAAEQQQGKMVWQQREWERKEQNRFECENRLTEERNKKAQDMHMLAKEIELKNNLEQEKRHIEERERQLRKETGRLEFQRLEKMRLHLVQAEQLVREKLENEQTEKEQLEEERLEKEQLEREWKEKLRKEQDQKEMEEKQRKARELEDLHLKQQQEQRLREDQLTQMVQLEKRIREQERREQELMDDKLHLQKILAMGGVDTMVVKNDQREHEHMEQVVREQLDQDLRRLEGMRQEHRQYVDHLSEEDEGKEIGLQEKDRELREIERMNNQREIERGEERHRIEELERRNRDMQVMNEHEIQVRREHELQARREEEMQTRRMEEMQLMRDQELRVNRDQGMVEDIIMRRKLEVDQWLMKECQMLSQGISEIEVLQHRQAFEQQLDERFPLPAQVEAAKRQSLSANIDRDRVMNELYEKGKGQMMMHAMELKTEGYNDIHIEEVMQREKQGLKRQIVEELRLRGFDDADIDYSKWDMMGNRRDERQDMGRARDERDRDLVSPGARERERSLERGRTRSAERSLERDVAGRSAERDHERGAIDRERSLERGRMGRSAERDHERGASERDRSLERGRTGRSAERDNERGGRERDRSLESGRTGGSAERDRYADDNPPSRRSYHDDACDSQGSYASDDEARADGPALSPRPERSRLGMNAQRGQKRRLGARPGTKRPRNRGRNRALKGRRNRQGKARR